MSTAQIIDGSTTRLSTIYQLQYSKINIKELQKSPTKIAEILPFRVRFINIGIQDNYSPLNPAPIGIAIIGLNNYIL